MPQFTSRLKKGTWKIKLFFLVKLNGDKWNCFNSFSCLFRLLKSFRFVALRKIFSRTPFTCSECRAGSLPSLPAAFCSSSVHSTVRLRSAMDFGQECSFPQNYHNIKSKAHQTTIIGSNQIIKKENKFQRLAKNTKSNLNQKVYSWRRLFLGRSSVSARRAAADLNSFSRKTDFHSITSLPVTLTLEHGIMSLELGFTATGLAKCSCGKKLSDISRWVCHPTGEISHPMNF